MVSHAFSSVSTQSLDDLLFWVELSRISGVESHTFCQLLQAFGSPKAVFEASLTALQLIVSEKISLEIKRGVDDALLVQTREWLSVPNNFIVTLADEGYPKSLLEIADPPPLFHAKGNIRLLSQASIAIVGSRNASVQGEKNAHEFAYALANQGLCIVSGLALGIDGAAHRGALAATGATIAVLGTGLDIVYPAKHRDLAHQIVEHGLMISEFPLGTPSKAQNFPKRNRIISGLSLGCLVVEANVQSGSQITARFAGEQGREVFAIPGSIHSPTAKGCHQLIKQGAKLVDCIQDVLDELSLKPYNQPQNALQESEDLDEVHPLLAFVSYEPTALESIVQQSRLTVGQVSSMLMLLELEGKVASLAGGLYQRIS